MATLVINGTRRDIDADPQTPLLWAIRDIVGLTGTKFGCGIGACGACTVHVDGRDPLLHRRSPTPAGHDIATIEGLSPRRRSPGPARLGGEQRSPMRLMPSPVRSCRPLPCSSRRRSPPIRESWRR
jgi:hypothetical protein